MHGTFMDNQNIKRILKDWKLEASEYTIDMLYDYVNGTVNIYTTKPGYLIGQGGRLIDKYKQELMLSVDGLTDVLIFEVNSIW